MATLAQPGIVRVLRDRPEDVRRKKRADGVRASAQKGDLLVAWIPTRYRRGSPVATLLPQYLLDCGKGARVVLLSEPEGGLLPDVAVAVRFHQFDEHQDALIVRKLRDREDRFLAHTFIGIVIDRLPHGAGGFLPRLLRQPEQRLAPNVRGRIVFGEIDQLVNGAGLFRLRDRE